jgi:Leucine-rich repeat (LRR) protein
MHDAFSMFATCCCCCHCQVLGLEDNAISDWCEVLRLAGLSQLRRLHLSGNPISSIAYPGHSIGLTALLSEQPPAAAAPDKLQQQQQQPFGQLEALLLGNCHISSWADVDALNRLPRLAELRLSGNPLFAAEGGSAGGGRRYEVRRQHVRHSLTAAAAAAELCSA